ncbi:MAG: SDR family oxidoreductase [Pseudomonadota bacterium]
MDPGRALITGAGSRIGRALALDLARAGWDVAVHYNRSAEGAERTAEEAGQHGVRAAALGADLLDWAATEALVQRGAEALGGPLTLLVNNASIFEPDAIGSVTEESWTRHVGSNLRAPLQLIQAFAGQAPEVGRDAGGEPVATGLVINMVDQRVLKPTPFFATYTIAKIGLWGLTRTAAQGLAPRIRVNALGPGPTVQGVRQSPEHFAAQRAATPLGRGSSPEEMCRGMQFLIGADGLTGQLICLDGGQHLAWQTPDVLGTE